jgi:hypothetical protein
MSQNLRSGTALDDASVVEYQQAGRDDAGAERVPGLSTLLSGHIRVNC